MPNFGQWKAISAIISLNHNYYLIKDRAEQKTIQQLNVIEHKQLIPSKYIWKLSNRRAGLNYCIARPLDVPVWVVCADCTLPPRALLPSEVGHPQNTPPCLHSLCTAWQHSYRQLSSSECVRSWIASSWKTNHFWIKKKKKVILIQSSPFLCLHWRSWAMRSGLLSVWSGSYIMYQIDYLKSKAKAGEKLVFHMHGWKSSKHLFHVPAATSTLNLHLSWLFSHLPPPVKKKTSTKQSMKKFYSQQLFYVEMNKECHFKEDMRGDKPLLREEQSAAFSALKGDNYSVSSYSKKENCRCQFLLWF